MAERRQKFWGWGWEDEGPTAEQQQRIAQLLAARFGIAAITIAAPPRIEEITLRPPRLSAAGAAGGHLLDRRRTIAPRTPTASRSATSCAPCAATTRIRPTSSPSRGTSTTSSRCSTGARARGAAAIPYGGGSSVVGGVEPPGGDAYRGTVSIDLRQLDRVARDRPHVARGAHPGRRVRAGARGAAAPARLHAAPLPAVVRVLLARRLDRDALRRPLRHALHAHRRLRRVAARGDADRRHRVAPPARLRRRPEPGSHVHRLRGHARHHHRGVDAAAGSADVPQLGVGDVHRLHRRGRRDARHQPGGALPVELPPARCRRGDDRGCRQTATSGADRRLRVGRPLARRVDGARARMLPRSRRHGSRRRGQDAHRPGRRTRGRGRRVAAVVPRRAVPARRAGRRWA